MEKIKDRHFERYSMKYPIEVNRSDQTISKSYKRCSKRKVELWDLDKVRTEMGSQNSVKKKEKVTERLSMEVDEMEDENGAGTMTISRYLSSLLTFVIAISNYGAEPRDGQRVTKELRTMMGWCRGRPRCDEGGFEGPG